MRGRVLAFVVVVAALVVVAIVLYRRSPSSNNASAPADQVFAPTGPVTSSVSVPLRSGIVASTNGGPPVEIVRARSRQVLATVNGVAITLKDLMPLNPAEPDREQTLSRSRYEFLLQRAIEREVILQAAKAKGVTLDESQNQQVAKMRAMREQPEPGVVKQLTKNPAQIDFEVRDAEAFLLQTTLLAQTGASPHVTSEQVQNYYQEHKVDFGELPADPAAHDAAWQAIDFKIRQQLASGTETKFQEQLDHYMGQLKSNANIVVVAPQN